MSKIVVFANRFLGFNCLKYLIDEKYPLSYIVPATKEDTQIEKLAHDNSIPFAHYYPGIQEELAERFQNGDWLISFWSAHVLIPTLLNAFKNTLNVHPSLVPLNQGNDCAAWTIRDQTKAGVTIMTMNEQVDKGYIYCQKYFPYSFPITGAELYDSLLKLCLSFFSEKWPDIYTGKIRPEPQTGYCSNHTRIQTNQDRQKKASEVMSLEEMINWALAHDFHPGTTAEVVRNGRVYKLRLSLEEIQFNDIKSD